MWPETTALRYSQRTMPAAGFTDGSTFSGAAAETDVNVRSVAPLRHSLTMIIAIIVGEQVELDGGRTAGVRQRCCGRRRPDAGRRRGWRDGRWSATRRHEQLLQHRRRRTRYSCLS